MEIIPIMGFIAGALTTYAFFPQLVKIYKTRKTQDLSFRMYLILSVGILIWLVYGFLIKSWPIIIANFISFIAVFNILFFIVSHHKEYKQK